MKIAIDLHGIVGKRAGKANFALNLCKNLLKIDKDNEYTIFTDQSILKLFDTQNFEEIVFEKHFHLKTLLRLKKNDFDIYFSPTSFIVSRFFPKKIKTRLIITVHDLVAFLYPEGHKKKSVIIEKFTLPESIRRSEKIISVSSNTKKDLITKFPYSKNKIEIVYNAANETFSKDIPEEKRQEIRKKYDLPENFILSVGTIEPRKNLKNLILGFYNLPENIYKNYSLVLVGNKGWKYEEIFSTAQKGFDERKIKFLKFVPDEDLPCLYKLSKIFVFPSLYEGFGIPILESFASGTPVITSNVSSMPEVAEKSAILVKPHDYKDIASAIEKLINSKDIYNDLSEKGRLRARDFSWEKSAKKLKRIFESV